MVKRETKRPGRKPLENRALVRVAHLTIKMSAFERDVLATLVALRRDERVARGISGAFTASAYFRELMYRDARRRRVLKRLRTMASKREPEG